MVATVIHTSDVPVWKAPKFHQRCCELVTRLQERAKFISLQFRDISLPGSFQLKAEIAWRNEVFSVLLCPLDSRAVGKGNLCIIEGDKAREFSVHEQEQTFAAILDLLKKHAEKLTTGHEGQHESQKAAELLLNLLW